MSRKYPRTYHVPWSPGATREDRIQTDLSLLEGREVVVTEKMDGENTTITEKGWHARSLDTPYHESRTRVGALQGRIGWQLKEGMRICGENVFATHSIRYTELEAYFLAFSLWITRGEVDWCCSWESTKTACKNLGVSTVPILWVGYLSSIDQLRSIEVDAEESEGWVVRPLSGFTMTQFPKLVLKWVREDHVQTDEHWLREKMETNELSET